MDKGVGFEVPYKRVGVVCGTIKGNAPCWTSGTVGSIALSEGACDRKRKYLYLYETILTQIRLATYNSNV